MPSTHYDQPNSFNSSGLTRAIVAVISPILNIFAAALYPCTLTLTGAAFKLHASIVHCGAFIFRLPQWRSGEWTRSTALRGQFIGCSQQGGGECLNARNCQARRWSGNADHAQRRPPWPLHRRGYGRHAGRKDTINHRVATHTRGVQESQQCFQCGGCLGTIVFWAAKALLGEQCHGTLVAKRLQPRVARGRAGVLSR